MKLPWHLLGFDLETTGLDSKKNCVCQIGALLISPTFETLEQFKTFMLNDLKKASFSQANATANLSVSSNYFLLEAIAQIGNNRSTLYSIIQRDDTGKCHVIARSQGVW